MLSVRGMDLGGRDGSLRPGAGDLGVGRNSVCAGGQGTRETEMSLSCRGRVQGGRWREFKDQVLLRIGIQRRIQRR